MKALLLGFLLLTQPLHAICVNANKVTLYKGPGSQFPKSWVVGKYTPLQEIERKDRWVKVKDQDGEVHWAPSNQLTSKVRCISIKSSVAQLRTGAGPQFPAPGLFMTVDKYTPFKRIESDGPWIQVENDFGINAWVHEKNIWRPVSIVKMNY